ncbi:restriction endonuclease [bacterium]|nr:restriction endonuclease [bacterium]
MHAYLKMANLIHSEQRSIYKITQDGLALLQKKPESISVKLLKSIPGFREKVSPNKKQEPILEDDTIESNTPVELIEIGYNKIREELINQLLDMIKANSPSFFENLVIDLLIKVGYGGNKIEYGEVVGKSGDEGIDGIIKEDKLGLDKIYIQAKKWENTVGRPEIQKFVGALQGKRAKKGIFITTSTFSKEALDYSTNIDTNIVLIDGEQLAELMLDHELGVSVKDTYKICRIDTDYFEE